MPVRNYLKKLPFVGALSRGAALLRADRHSPQFVLPGHFYSPIPDLRRIEAEAARIFARTMRDLPGIDLRETAQLDLLMEFAHYYKELPWEHQPQSEVLFYWENEYYSYSDAIFLFCMIRHARPVQIVEIGSGFSSAVTLDTNMHFFGGAIRLTFIEPHPERLLTLISAVPAARASINLVQARVEQIDRRVFANLERGDILFIDSTHVSKAGSDVNFLLFEVLPLLKSGVYIHFHDVYYPFQYPEDVVKSGRAWNESYLLRAFLMYNDSFQIVAFNTFLEQFHEEWFRSEMPLCLLNRGGSIWLQKK